MLIKTTTNKNTWLGVMLTLAPALTFADIVQVGPAARPEIMSNNQVRDIMVRETLENYGYCACPYSRDALGGQCGTESEYYKPGAFRVYCYRIDIPSEEVYFFRLKRITAIQLGTSYHDLESGSYEILSPEINPAASYFRNNAENTGQSYALESGVRSSPPGQPATQDLNNPAADYFKNTGQINSVRISNNPNNASGGYGSPYGSPYGSSNGYINPYVYAPPSP